MQFLNRSLHSFVSIYRKHHRPRLFQPQGDRVHRGAKNCRHDAQAHFRVRQQLRGLPEDDPEDERRGNAEGDTLRHRDENNASHDAAELIQEQGGRSRFGKERWHQQVEHKRCQKVEKIHKSTDVCQERVRKEAD